MSNNNHISLSKLERINPSNNNDLLILDEYNQVNHDFNLHDCSFTFILRCYSLVNVITDVVNSLSLDNSELIYD